MEPLFIVNPKKGLPEDALTIENKGMALVIRSNTIYLANIYVFENDKLRLQDMDLKGNKAEWLNFFSSIVWPLLGKDTSNTEELILNDNTFLEILYKRLWPATKADFEKLFHSHDIYCTWTRGQYANTEIPEDHRI